jgi:hypothetical protein
MMRLSDPSVGTQERDCPGDECSFFRDDDPAVAAERNENWRSYVQSEQSWADGHDCNTRPWDYKTLPRLPTCVFSA